MGGRKDGKKGEADDDEANPEEMKGKEYDEKKKEKTRENGFLRALLLLVLLRFQSQSHGLYRFALPRG